MLFGQVYFAVARCSARESHLAHSVNQRGVSLSQLPLLCFRSASRSCDVEERAAKAEGLIHCSRLLYQQVAGHLERLTCGAGGVCRLLQALQHVPHGSKRLFGQLSIELCLGF